MSRNTPLNTIIAATLLSLPLSAQLQEFIGLTGGDRSTASAKPFLAKQLTIGVAGPCVFPLLTVTLISDVLPLQRSN